MKNVLTVIAFATCAMFVLGFATPVRADDDRRGPRKVNCDKEKTHKGKRLQRALNRAKVGDVILVKGTCIENVTVTTD